MMEPKFCGSACATICCGCLSQFEGCMRLTGFPVVMRVQLHVCPLNSVELLRLLCSLCELFLLARCMRVVVLSC